MSDLEIEEREVRMAQLRADTDNKRALSRPEPYKVMTAVVAAVATVVAGVFGVLGYILGRGH